MPMILIAIISFVGFFVFFVAIRGLSDNTPITDNPEQQNQRQNKEFVQELLPVAKQIQEQYGLLPSISIGQAILESDWGTSELSAKYNNLFGIKSFSPEDDFVKLKTKEFKDGKWIEVSANFKVYKNWEECMLDHAALFAHGVDWDPYLYNGVLLADNYQTAASALQVAGYATDPTYAKKIVDVIESHKLYQYD
ncbi:glycoside hydrolase family 73 protein [Vagococcus penaei]